MRIALEIGVRVERVREEHLPSGQIAAFLLGPVEWMLNDTIDEAEACR